MKKLRKRTKLLLLTMLALIAVGIYLLMSFNPELINQDYVYYPVKNYKVSSIKPKKKVIKKVSIELFHNLKNKDEAPQDGTWVEVKDYSNYQDDPLLHVTFTDGSKATFILQEKMQIGNGLDVKNSNLYRKLNLRFPNIKAKENYPSVLEYALQLYVGDTLYQSKSSQSVTSFQVKNPKSGKMQTYYQYGNKPQFDWKPVFFMQSKKTPKKERQEFFDDYHKDGENNYWDRKFDFSDINKLSRQSDYYYYKLFYSDRLTNIPVNISTTGNHFEMTIIQSYMVPVHNGLYQKLSINKTYTEDDKEKYTSEILNN